MFEDLHAPPIYTERQDDDAEFLGRAEAKRNQLMAELREKGKVVAQIGGPAWMGAVSCVAGVKWWADEITKPTKAINRWSMAGGQLRTTTMFTKCGDDELIFFAPTSMRLDVLVRDSSKWIVKASGTVEDFHAEMDCEIAVFGRGTDQRIVDGVADLLVRKRDTEDHAERVALMALRSKCHSCNRPLKDEISKIVGFGPDCARQSGIPHNLEFARQVERHRTRLVQAMKD